MRVRTFDWGSKVRVSRQREIFEGHWGVYYWRVMAAAMALAFLIQYPWTYRGDLITDALFLAWTGLMLLVARRYPFHARLIHALGIIPLLAFYVRQTDTAVPYEYHAELYVLLAFFPIYAATAMAGLFGFVVSVFLATLLGGPFLKESPIVSIATFFWGLSGLLGLGYYHMARKLEEYHRKLLEQALTDPLTGLRNRRALEEDYRRFQALAKREGKRLVLTLWDVNNLKKINDQYGHEAGDRILKRFARILKESTRKSDALYRIGGDEFVGLHLGLEVPESFLERVRERFPWTSSGWVDATELSYDEAYRRADKLMYRNKEHKLEDLARLTSEDWPEP